MKVLSLVLALTFLFVTPVSPEQITLTTYYPAPYGVYRELITTDNTYLATEGGNVGVGTTIPVAKLEIEGSGDRLFQVEDIDNNNGLFIGTDSDMLGYIRVRPTAGSGIAITNQGDEIGLYVRAADGNVGIGTVNPQAQLHIDGTAGIDGIMFPDGTLQTTAALGAWTSRDSLGNTILGNLSNGSTNRYRATGDGFLVAKCNGNFANVHIFVRFGGVGSFVSIYEAFANAGGAYESATVPIGRDDIFYVNTSRHDNILTIRWKPFGEAQLIKQ